MVHVQAVRYWTLFGVAITTGAAVVVGILVRVQDAFEAQRFTRDVLQVALAWCLVALLLFMVAGWALARRPAPPPREETPGYTYT